MSERRFTKLKASLSEHGTAAKTRETVSRGLRESLNVNNDSSILTCVENDYENNVRQWENELKQSEHNFAKRFLVIDHDDIKCLDKPKDLKFDFNQHYSSDKLKITSPFSHECIKHYTDCKHIVNFASMAKYFGTVFDTFAINKNSPSSSSDFGEMFTSKSFLTNFPLRPHIFECDEDEYDSGFCGQKMLIREGHASVIDVGDGDFVNGWLTLSRDEHNCFLTFCDTHRRNKILWHIEVNKKVEKLSDDKNGFKVNNHIIRTDHNFIDDWIKDINSHIFIEFTPEEELDRILKRDLEIISEKLKSYELINNINLFAAYNDLNLRKDFLNKFTEDINCINSEQLLLKHSHQSKKIFKFLLTIKSSDIANNDRNSKTNFTESYFYRISLFDCKLGKISEEFRYVVSPDINIIRSSGLSMEQNRCFDPKICSTIHRALFKVDLSQSNPNDLYLVLRVERTSHRLSNYICYPVVTPQMSSNNNNKINNQSIILQHVEPYAWSIRPLFHSDTITLETTPNFGLFYKMDQNRLSDEFICNILNQLSQSTSTRSQTVINGRLEVELIDYKIYMKQMKISNESTNNINNNNNVLDLIFNPSLFIQHQKQQNLIDLKKHKFNPILEVQPLRLLSEPHTEFFNILYIYPQSLKFDSQRVFSKARNLCVTIEIRDDDNINESKPLNIIYGRPHDPSLFVTTATTSVSRHNVSPDFFEEIKVALPLYFSEKLHILFTLSHISCKKECYYSVVGYSWLPISSEKHQIHCQNMSLSVFASLPNNYLSCQSLGLGKGLSMPDVKVVGKEVFKVSLVLTSSIISRDFELHNTLLSIIKITRSNRDDSKEISHIISLERQIPKMLRNLQHCNQTELIHFSQVIIQQLFKLIVFAASQELIQESLNTIVCLADKFRRENNLTILHEFIYSTFYTAEFCGVYIHDQLIILLNKMFETYNQKSTNSIPNTDEMKLLLNNLWFLLQIITKSMIQYLITSDRIKMKREERFDEEFVSNLKSFFEESSILISTYSRMEEAQDANRALAHFMTRLCSFFDRSIIFNAFFHHVNILSSRDIVIQELKFNSIATLLSHEHFVCYCNPMQLQDTPVLTMNFCSKHFPAFLILNEFKSLYHQSATSVRQIRQLALSIIRNQLTKHMLDDRYSELDCRQKVLTLYLPILSVILENSNRMMDSTVPSNPNTYASNHGVVTNLSTTSSHFKHQTSSFATIPEHQHNPNTLDTLNSLLVRSTSEISSTLSSISSYGSINSNSTMGSANTLTHNRTNSTVSTVRFDKFSHEEVKDLFICFLCVVQVMNTDRMNLLNKKQLKDLFLCLECAINCFEYKPKKFTDHRSKTMPNPITNHHQSNHHATFNHHLTSNNNNSNNTGATNASENHLTNYLLQQNLSIQSALITLRTIHLYLDNDREPIDHSITQILSIYLTLMSLPQSQTVLIHLFNSIRYFVQKFSILLFNSDAFLSPIISKVIKYCNSSLTPIRQGATDLLYCLFATNIKRTRFETIVCVSRLASSDPHGLIYLHSSLNRLEQLATADVSSNSNRNSNNKGDDKNKTDQDQEDEEISITNIVERIREILKATKQIREEYFDPYSASELRLQLANSYARTSRSLLRTWLENLSEVHVKNHDWAEAAMCLCQVIAILIEQLSSKEIHIIDGMLNISKVSDNIMTKDSIKRESDWLELEESHVSIEVLESIINECVGLFEKGELFELAPHVLKVVMSTYEKEYEHKKLSMLYTKIAKMHSKAQEINDSGKRIFDTFFRVSFYYLNTGQKMEYIYKMTKLVTLSEMTTKMQTFYPNATFLAADSPAIQQIESNSQEQDSNSEISNGDISTNKQCSNLIIVITHVNPYIENAKNQFEKNVGVQSFVYEQRLDTKIAQSVAEQYKKRVILTSAHSFPYFLKRIPVISKKEVILNPIDVAIDEMQERVHQLEYVIMNQDAKHLQLVLQGSVHVTVNCGPIAYANAFLKCSDNDKQLNGIVSSDEDDTQFENLNNNLDENQKHLKFLFEQFLDLCESALKLNERLIKSNQTEYHNNLKLNFEKLKTQLDFLNHRSTYIPIFDAISGSTFSPFT